MVSLFLSLGHIIFGIPLMGEVSADGIYIIDHYVFFLTIMFILLLSSIYVALYKDISEALSVFIIGVASLYSGLIDLIIYTILGFPQISYPFLINTPAGYLSKLIGMNTVTVWSLLGNIFMFGVITFFVVKYLLKFEAKIGKLEF